MKNPRWGRLNLTQTSGHRKNVHNFPFPSSWEKKEAREGPAERKEKLGKEVREKVRVVSMAPHCCRSPAPGKAAVAGTLSSRTARASSLPVPEPRALCAARCSGVSHHPRRPAGHGRLQVGAEWGSMRALGPGACATQPGS